MSKCDNDEDEDEEDEEDGDDRDKDGQRSNYQSNWSVNREEENTFIVRGV